MKPFLKSVARAYKERYGDLSEFCFMFPNKRSARFFQNYLTGEFQKGSVALAPYAITISDLMSTVSGMDVDTHVDMLFRLHSAYTKVLSRMKASTNVELEKFLSWGETILSDFNEVDLYCVNPDDIFKNVRDYREISADYLTDAQRRVLERYFGRSYNPKAAGRFWENFEKPGDSGRKSKIKERFVELWRVLAPLYKEFNADLEKDGLTTPGGIYRLTDERLAACPDMRFDWKKMVAVGFNALSAREASIFERLSNMRSRIEGGDDSFMDFVWDLTGPVLGEKDSGASRFIDANRREFGEPDWLEPYMAECSTKHMPSKVRLVASPSNAAQVKIAGEIVGDLYDRIGPQPFLDARVAVVLPDEKLLLPMLSSLPEMKYEFEDKKGNKEFRTMGVNLTMGYEFRLTSTISFVKHLRMLHKTRQYGGGDKFYQERVLNLLSHPYMHVLMGQGMIGAIKKWMTEKHVFNMSAEDIIAGVGKYAEGREVIIKKIFRVLDERVDPADVVGYIYDVMSEVERVLGVRDDTATINQRLDRDHIRLYCDALRRLSDNISDNRAGDPQIGAMRADTVFQLAERILAAEKVMFEGEPLRGLQVMGMLETRLLDFDHIILCSLNEGVLPRKAHKRTFIPAELRKAYGLPLSGYEESIFAYYFYRLISRAQSVSLIYDSRITGGVGAKGLSRYGQQLIYLYAPQYMTDKGQFVREERQFEIHGRTGKDVYIEKTPEVMEMLEAFKKKDGKNMSASALKKYLSCPVAFFYRYVFGLNDDKEPLNTIDSLTQGNILHHIMENIYLDEGEKSGCLLTPPKLITETGIQNILDDKELMEKLLVEAVNKKFYNIGENDKFREVAGAERMIGDIILEEVRNILERDKQHAPFLLYGTEISDKFIMRTGSHAYNFKLKIDRMDCIDIETNPTLRIVDYKTGKPYVTAEAPDGIFGGNYKAGNAFQLLMYAYATNRSKLRESLHFSEEHDEIPIRLEIYQADSEADAAPNLIEIKDATFLEEFLDEQDYRTLKESYAKKPNSKNREPKEETFGFKIERHTQIAPYFNRRYEELIDEIFGEGRFEASDDCKMCSFKNLCEK